MGRQHVFLLSSVACSAGVAAGMLIMGATVEGGTSVYMAFGQEPLLTILDKGLLAIVVVAAVWLFNKSLEAFKYGLARARRTTTRHFAR